MQDPWKFSSSRHFIETCSPAALMSLDPEHRAPGRCIITSTRRRCRSDRRPSPVRSSGLSSGRRPGSGPSTSAAHHVREIPDVSVFISQLSDKDLSSATFSQKQSKLTPSQTQVWQLSGSGSRRDTNSPARVHPPRRTAASGSCRNPVLCGQNRFQAWIAFLGSGPPSQHLKLAGGPGEIRRIWLHPRTCSEYDSLFMGIKVVGSRS